MTENNNNEKKVKFCIVCRKPLEMNDTICRFCGTDSNVVLKGEPKTFNDIVKRLEKPSKKKAANASMVLLPTKSRT